MPSRVLDLDRPFGMTQAMKNGYEIWNLESEESLYIRSLKTAAKELAKCRLDLEKVVEVSLNMEGNE
jgi:hypothetical protein